jgi:hypothetical protein
MGNKFNIRDHSLNLIIDNYNIPEFWTISKDCIDGCKDCEYICIQKVIII